MMRSNITDKLTGEFVAWFNVEAAVLFREKTRWNGNNHISVNTGSEWNHQDLYYTKSGRWVLESSSPCLETLHEIDESRAIKWLCFNDCWDDDAIEKLPPRIKEIVKNGIAMLEI
jgi:hypothetical protein